MKKVLITDAVHPSILAEIKKWGYDIDYFPKMAYEKLGPIIHDYEGIIINSKIIMNKAMMDKAKKLHFIARLGSGLDIIDLDHAKNKNIAVISAPEGNCNAVGEHALGMLLALSNNLLRADREVRNLKWNREKNRGFELEGRKIGIIGFGHTGPAFAEKLLGFNADIYVYDKYKAHFKQAERLLKEASLLEIQEKCEIVSIHLPLTPETRFFIDSTFIKKCLAHPILINTSRGEIVKTEDLVNGLEDGLLSGACLDVFENEKPPSFNETEKALYARLYKMENVVLSPHIAGWTKESKKKIASTLVEKINAHLKNLEG